MPLERIRKRQQRTPRKRKEPANAHQWLSALLERGETRIYQGSIRPAKK